MQRLRSLGNRRFRLGNGKECLQACIEMGMPFSGCKGYSLPVKRWGLCVLRFDTAVGSHFVLSIKSGTCLSQGSTDRRSYIGFRLFSTGEHIGSVQAAQTFKTPRGATTAPPYGTSDQENTKVHGIHILNPEMHPPHLFYKNKPRQYKYVR